LDDKLTVYANKHGFSEAPAGFGYREYRSMLRKEREARLVMLEKQALQTSTEPQDLSANTTALLSTETVETNQERNIRLFNALLDQATQTGKTVLEIAIETDQCDLLEALDVPLDTV
jgi:hypothetical protein